MHVIYESTDAMIEYGLLNSDSRPWTAEYNANEPAGNSGPANSAAEEMDIGRDWTRTHTRDAFARIDFFGTSCRIQGWAAGTNVSVDLDGQSFMFSAPANPNDTFMILRDLPIGWHALRIVATAFQTEGVSNLSITRVVVDTGLPDGYQLESTFDADADEWTTDGDGWERRMTGNTPSRRTDRSGASAKFATNLTEASVVFLYGIAGPDHGGFAVSWVEPGSSIIGEPVSIRHAQRNISVENVLLYMGVVPKGGVRGISLQQADGWVIGPNDATRKLEFTRLEVYTSPNGNGFFDTLSVPASQLTTSIEIPTSSFNPQTTTRFRISPATIAAIVSVTGVVVICGALAFLIVRRRRRNRSLLSTVVETASDTESISGPPLSAAASPFDETARQVTFTQAPREKSRGVHRRDRTVIPDSSLATFDSGNLSDWAASSHDPDVQPIGEDGAYPKLEFTRLEIYKSPNGSGFFDSLSVPVPQPTTSINSPTPSFDPKSTNSPGRPYVSPGTIAVIVSVTSVVILCAALAYLLFRRRRNRTLRTITADMSSDMDEIDSLPPSAVPFPFEETIGRIASTQAPREKSRGVPRRDQTLMPDSPLAAPDSRPVDGWAASSHDPEMQSVLSASTQPPVLAAGVGVRDSVALISESHPPAYEETQIRH